MKSKLILIGGEAWTGKSTCAEILYKELHNSAWLDGDDVWRVNPWSADDPRLRTSDINMAFVLQTYLQSKFDYVILSSIVLSVPSITERILQRIHGVDYELVSFTMMCDERTLIHRAKQRDQNLIPNFLVLDQTKTLSNTIKINTANTNPDDVVHEILSVVCGRSN
jgi:gluconate kinase